MLLVALITIRARHLPSAAAVTLLLLIAFVLSGKVYSPQYTLWLLPLVAVCVRQLSLVVAWQAAELVYWSTEMWAWVPADWQPAVGVSVLTLRIGATLLVAAYVIRHLSSSGGDLTPDRPEPVSVGGRADA